MKTSIVFGVFNGSLAGFATSAYGDMVQFGLKREVAHQVALDYMSDLGNAMRSDSELNAKVGKAKKRRRLHVQD